MSDDVLAVAEHRQGELRPVSTQLLTVGHELATQMGGDLHVAVVSGDVDSFADQLNRNSVDTIHTVDYGEEFNHDIYTQATEALVDDIQPGIVLTPNSVNGLDYAPAVARGLDRPLVTDVTDFEFDDDTLVVTREMYGSKVEADVAIEEDTALLTVRGGEWAPTETEGDADVQAADVTIDEDALGTTVTGFETGSDDDIDISEAEFIVSIGRGIEEEENLDLIKELVDVTGATLASSRPIVDSGWLSKSRQVGQSGKTVTPDVYIAIGISGAVQHVAGMKDADTIVAINTDPEAPIFDIADYGVVGDLFEVVPALIDQLE